MWVNKAQSAKKDREFLLVCVGIKWDASPLNFDEKIYIIFWSISKQKFFSYDVDILTGQMAEVPYWIVKVYRYGLHTTLKHSQTRKNLSAVPTIRKLMCSMFIWLVEYTVLHILENNVKIFIILLVIKNYHTVI